MKQSMYMVMVSLMWVGRACAARPQMPSVEKAVVAPEATQSLREKAKPYVDRAGAVLFHAVVIPLVIPFVVCSLARTIGLEKKLSSGLMIGASLLGTMEISPEMEKRFASLKLSDSERRMRTLVAVGTAVLLACRK